MKLKYQDFTCAICLDHHAEHLPCHSCGALKIGRNYYDAVTARHMVRGIPYPTHRMIAAMILWAESQPEPVPALPLAKPRLVKNPPHAIQAS